MGDKVPSPNSSARGAQLNSKALVRMNLPELPISIVVVDAPEGMKHYVALLPSGVAFESGIIPEAIVGALLYAPEPGRGITPENFARNSVFADFLHSVVERYAPSVPGLVSEAKRQGEGVTPAPGSPVKAHD